PDMRPNRRGWFERLLARAEDNEHGLEIALRAVRDLPEEPSLWDRAEKLAREVDRPEVVGAVYRSVIQEAEVLLREGALEDVGRRAVDYLEEWFDEPDTVIALLRRMIAADPTARWAFERLKLIYNSVERWDQLFQLYDDVLARAPD